MRLLAFCITCRIFHYLKSLNKNIYMFFFFLAESPVPMNVILSINHSVFVKGDQTNFTIEASFSLEAFVLYLDVMYTCIDEYLSHFA